MNTAVLTGLAAAFLSLLFEYVPGFATWYQKLPAVGKRLVMIGALVAAAAFIFVLANAGLLGPFNWDLPPGEAGLVQLLGLLGTAIATNQPFHALVKKG